MPSRAGLVTIATIRRAPKWSRTQGRVVAVLVLADRPGAPIDHGHRSGAAVPACEALARVTGAVNPRETLSELVRLPEDHGVRTELVDRECHARAPIAGNRTVQQVAGHHGR